MTRSCVPILLVLALLATACSPAVVPTSTALPPVQTEISTVAPPPTATTEPTSTPQPTATLEPSATTAPSATPAPTEPAALPAEPQEVAFAASDGTELQGRYYPADHERAPLVVLVHWVNGNMNDWNEVAVWLQNRGQANPFANPGNAPWWDSSWFPEIPDGQSYAVFTFSLRNCTPEGCPNWEPDKWLLDVQAAMQAAVALEGIDPQRIVVAGSSIGADGAPNGCLWINEEKLGGCVGALSLSPGDYMGQPYKAVVKTLSEAQPAVPVTCLADDTEIGICQQAGEFDSYQALAIPGGGHGNILIKPNLEPLPLQILLDFLATVTK